MALYSADISLVGLCMDFSGAILIWMYGLPGELNKSGFKPAVGYPADDSTLKKIAQYGRMASIGLVLLIAGFALQAVATYLGRTSSGALVSPVESQQEMPPRQK
ncbi:MAG: hypothetical protein WDM96_04905 [Lacunisphaera sp.]